jgi:hypothetical protein
MHLAGTLGPGLADTLWPWLFPSTYLIHIAEEYWGGDGYSAHMAKTRGIKLTPSRFIFLTSLGGLIMTAAIFLAVRLNFPQLVLVIFGTVVLANGLSHTINGLLTSRYNPGLYTGLLLWIPLGALTLARLSGSMGAGRYLTGMALGVGIQLSVSLVAKSGGNIREG